MYHKVQLVDVSQQFNLLLFAISQNISLSQHQEHLPIMELFKSTDGAAIKVRPASQQFHRQCNVKNARIQCIIMHSMSMCTLLHDKYLFGLGKLNALQIYVFNAMLNKLVSEKSH